MKSLGQMDIDEWELLPDEGFLEINDDDGEKIYSRNHAKNASSVFQMNYFICPEKTLPAPIELEPHDQAVPVVIDKTAPEPDPVSQVFFKKMKETEFVDMKVDSPKSSSGREVVPQLDFQFEEKAPELEEDGVEVDQYSEQRKMDRSREDEAGLNKWKWSLTRIGAFCTFAATVCLISLSGHHKNHKRHQKLKFQFYTNDKRMKQVVHHASKINEAIAAVRGVPITRAHITFGGYYDAPSL